MEVVDLSDESIYAGRRLHSRNGAMQTEGLRRLATSFVESPETILQQLVNAAIQLCGADSAGVSIVRKDATENGLLPLDRHSRRVHAFSGSFLAEMSQCMQRVP